MNHNALSELNRIFPANQIKSDPESLLNYGRDWTRYYTPNPMAIVFPKSTDDVQKLVQWARKSKTSLVPSGGRTGLSGGAVAKNGEVVVSFDLMNKILGFNAVDMTVQCEAGVITENLQRFVKGEGYLFPVDFASRGSSHIGGNIATNAGGINVIRYGMMREWVAALTVVTGQGEILHLNNGLVKNATGYDLRQLFIGSEGTLGFVTEATLRVTTPPRPTWVLVMGAPDQTSIMNVYSAFKRELPLTAFEMFTDKALEYVLKNDTHLQAPLSVHVPFYILVEVELTTSQVEEDALKVFEVCLEKGWIQDGVLSQSESQARDLWKLRENISEACSKYTPYKNDISVTVSNATRFMEETSRELTAAYPHFEVVWFGHIGDGNLHINILKPSELSMDEFVQSCQKVDHILFSIIKKYRGSISAEHGVGLSKKPFLQYTRSKSEVEMMIGIKKVFDPDHIMNPGKIFD